MEKIELKFPFVYGQKNSAEENDLKLFPKIPLYK